jgi:hypothetical protein
MESNIAADTDQEFSEVVIRGVTTQGRTFRPSDWADRLAGVVAELGTDLRLNYGPYAQPVTRAGVRCVVINRLLEQVDGAKYRFMLDFARDNHLEVVEGRRQPRG